MLDTTLIVYLLFIHWVADFVLQTDKMAKGKSSSNKWLLAHTGMYTLFIIVATLNPMYGVINGLLHTIVDYVTSRWTSRLWQKGDVHNFFVVIGLDQFIHVAILLITAIYLL